MTIRRRLRVSPLRRTHSHTDTADGRCGCQMHVHNSLDASGRSAPFVRREVSAVRIEAFRLLSVKQLHTYAGTASLLCRPTH